MSALQIGRMIGVTCKTAPFHDSDQLESPFED